MFNDVMETDLTPIKAALADISDTEFAALIAATYGVPQTAPGLLAWIDSACESELNRRRDFYYPLLPPEAAIDPSEDEVSINAAIAIRATFAEDSPAVRSLFDALVALLTSAGRKHEIWSRRAGSRRCNWHGSPVNRVGDRVTPVALPHHRTCGSAYGGS
jgi:hypothetical protein